ncbi:MAG: hypothetical protein M1821_009829 [Bathelium mastoideum]|nr:MAG: hypothetical protein M1821_009829 [Bathelium mastoideum]
MSDLTIDYSIVPKDSLVLVTGVTGYIGSHVVDQCLKAGFRVRGTARDTRKAAWIKDIFDKEYGPGRFEEIVIKDMVAEGAFDEAVQGCVGVIHVASIMSFSANPHEVIPPTIAGVINCMKAAKKEASVKRLVYTSSSTACLTPIPNKEIVVDKETWNQDAIKQAWKAPPYQKERAFTVYAASKTQAEYEAWEFMKKEEPNFTFSTVLPNMNWGRIISVDNQGHPSTSAHPVYLYQGDVESCVTAPPQWYVDVEDDARLHVAALTRRDTTGERIFAFTAPFNWNDVLAQYRTMFPGKKFVDDIEGQGRDLSKIPNERAEQLLKEMGRTGWTSMEETLRKNLESVV